MSHCTKFAFSYNNEEAIVRAFKKMGIKCSTGLVSEFNSDFSKKVLGKLGYLGKRQYRAIYGRIENGNIFLCKVDEGRYELFIEHAKLSDNQNDEKIANNFRNAYIEVAVDKVLKKLDLNATRYEINKQENGIVVNFGPNLEYAISVLSEKNQIVEDVKGIKGELCTKLTEDIEDVLSNPSAELLTEWKPEVEMQVEDEVLQVLSLSF